MFHSSLAKSAALRMSVFTAGILLGLIVTKSTVMAQDLEGHHASVVTFSGADWAKDSSSYYSGALISLQRNFDEDGWVLRVFGLLGDFEYDSTDVPGGHVDADATAADVMIGYQFTRDVMTATIYVGVDYLDFDLNPNDPTSNLNGHEVGFKVAADVETSSEIPFFLSASGAYSTAYDTYFAHLRLGYNTQRFVIGPEGLVAEQDSDVIYRLGGFATYRFDLTPINPVEITGYVGHQFAEEDDVDNSSGGEGTYGGVSFSVSF